MIEAQGLWGPLDKYAKPIEDLKRYMQDNYIEYPYMNPSRTLRLKYTLPMGKIKFDHIGPNWTGIPWTELRPKKNHHTTQVQYCYEKLWLIPEEPQDEHFLLADLDKILNKEAREFVEYEGMRRAAPYEKADRVAVYRHGYKALAERIQEEIGDIGRVFCSAKSGRPKILFLLKFPHKIKRITRKIAEAFFTKHIPQYLGIIDWQGCYTTYVSPLNKIDVMEALQSCTPMPVRLLEGHEKIDEDECAGEVIVQKDFRYSVAELEQLPKELRGHGSDKFEQFMCMLLCMANLTRRSGFGISQNVVEKTLGIDQTTASLYIQKAIKKGFLKVLSHAYQTGKRAKTYAACGLLRKAIKARKTDTERFELPTEIANGNWNAVLTSTLTKAFRHSPKAFLRWAKALPGIRHKDRWRQAQNIAKWFIRLYPNLSDA